MADTDAQPMTTGDVAAAGTATTAEPLKGGVTRLDDAADTTGTKATEAKQVIKDNASKYGQQAADKARLFAEDGKARAGTALEQVAQLLTDAAAQVDDKLGAQYGGYARSAADSVSGFAEQVRAKDIDALVDDVTALVRKSPAVAVGAAAALGFVIARLVQSGIDANPKD
ncbi:hypothetical protein [Sphingomonas sp. BK481]|uniref:hypothetical protein n=1 Tax=Sphingomonas sp. BK481 TaxID=2586981 RepID=UPI0016122E53|nr:hypothetical protein [Sphingomonas sp. BK481]MBB3585816.1 ElaB/YqjD/DUF883 family membrane-anchored ribosome-binding protein [Sphingomonas sp. BK481]